MRPLLLATLIASITANVACSDDATPLPVPPPDASARDAAPAADVPEDPPDAATFDAAEPADEGVLDTGPEDTGAVDVGPIDTGGEPDAGPVPCSESAQCNGACEGGPTCSDPWLCNPDVACTEDLVPYCGCDGVTFLDSSTCPAKPYSSTGECRPDAGVSCDRRAIRCRIPEPVCPEGETASVVGTCYGPCVPIDECECTEPAECPEPERYTCHQFRMRCGPFV